MNKLDPLKFPLHGIRLIEASAGTGKTYTIAALYVRLVIGHERPAPLMPADILVLTFTRAATRELRDRIRQRLSEAARSFISGESEHQFIRELLDLHADDDQRKQIARRLQVASESMDEAAIHTIHAWCQSVLRQYAFDSGSLFDQEVDSQDPELWRRAVMDYWRRFVMTYSHGDDSLLDAFGSFGNFESGIRKLLKPEIEVRAAGAKIAMIDEPAQAIEIHGQWKDSIEETLAPVYAQWTEQSEEIKAIVLDARARVLNGNLYREPTVQGWFDQLDARNLSHDIDKGPLFKLSVSGLAVGVKKDQSPPTHPFFETVEQARHSLEPLLPAPNWKAQLWKHALDWVAQRYRREKRQRNRLDFDDLLTGLDEALRGSNGERLRSTILAAHPVAMLDEFQDTDPVQYRIFETVYGQVADRLETGLFMIGDPKQAIYSFRQADIHTYLRARRTAIDSGSGPPFTLPRNFRSTNDFVKAVNTVFEAAEGQVAGAFAMREGPEQDNPIPFEGVDAEGREETFVLTDSVGRVKGGPRLLPAPGSVSGKDTARSPAPPMVFWHLPPESGENVVGRQAYEAALSRWTAAAIADLLEQGKADRAGFESEGTFQAVTPGDIAVLVYDRHQAAAVIRELEKRGVAAVYLSESNSIFDQPEAMDLLLILRAVAEPDNDWLLRNALGTRTIGLGADELERLNSDELRLEIEIERCQRLHELLKRRGLLAMVRRLIDEFQVAERMLADRSSGERRLTNLMHLAELLQVESQALDSPQALIRWLAIQIETEERGQNDEQVLRLESDAELVRIVTIFQSKGLEYPLVFVPFAAANRRQPRAGKYWPEYHDPASGKRVIDLQSNEESRRIAARERLQEDLRLLYVAMTRARHACWIGTTPWADGRARKPATDTALCHLLSGLLEDKETLQLVDMDTLLQRLVERIKAAGVPARRVLLDSQPPQKRFSGRGEQPLEPAADYPGLRYEHWWVASYSALRHGRPHDAGMGEDAESAAIANLAEMSEEEKPADAADVLPDPASLEPKPDSIHAFPRGATPGNFLHLLLEWAGARDFSRLAGNRDAIRQECEKRCKRRGWVAWSETIAQWLERQIESSISLGDVSLRLADLSLAQHQYKPELEFWLQASRVPAASIDKLVRRHILPGKQRPALASNQLNGMLHGFIDLVFEWQGRWYVADYKSNWLGPDARYYTRMAMEEAILSRRYDLQYVLYSLALHRQLASRLGQGYEPTRHLGGAAYLFARGVGHPETAGVFFDPVSPELICALDELFRKGVQVDAA